VQKFEIEIIREAACVSQSADWGGEGVCQHSAPCKKFSFIKKLITKNLEGLKGLAILIVTIER
jgi:hypothetical protein